MAFADSPLGDRRGLFHFQNLIRLLSHRSLGEVLAEALSLLVNAFQVTGGSIFYASILVERARQGELPDVAQEQVDTLEEISRARLHRGARQIQLPSAPPVTRHDLPCSGVLYTIPLISHDRTCGIISLYISEGQELSHYQMQDLSWFAGGISAIATNVEQLNVTRQRLSQLGLFYQMGQAITSTFDINRLFQETIDMAAAVLDAQEAVLMLLDRERRALRHRVTHGGDAVSQPRYVKLGSGIAGWVAQHGNPVLLNDVTTDDRFDPEIDGLAAQATKSLICVPLQIKGAVIGVLGVFNKASPFLFDEEDLSVLITLAAQVSIALDNARLYNSLRAERDRIIEAQESTRHALARHLHDGPVQLLASIAMGLDYLERVVQVKPEDVPAELDSLRRQVRQATQDARMLLFELRPVILETQGLVPALESYVERLGGGERFMLHFDPGNYAGQLSSSVGGTIFAIVQEAINNIQKHAKARTVRIVLHEEDGELVVTIEDDGVGFDIESVTASYDRGTSFGLLNMRELAELIDGRLRIESGPERGKPGTLISLRMSLPKPEEQNDG